MFYDSSKFKILEAGVQLSMMQQQINTQNIANLETAGYKSQSMTFNSVLSAAKNDAESSEVSKIRASIVSSDAVSKQPNGNNVDLEAESISLYKAYSQYSMLLGRISGEFNKYSYVLNCNM